MLLLGEGSKACFDVLPAALVVESLANRLGDEGAAAATAHLAVEAGDEVVLERYVQSHGHTVTHRGPSRAVRRRELAGERESLLDGRAGLREAVDRPAPAGLAVPRQAAG